MHHPGLLNAPTQQNCMAPNILACKVLDVKYLTCKVLTAVHWACSRYCLEVHPLQQYGGTDGYAQLS
jgi:hypothetical protein